MNALEKKNSRQGISIRMLALQKDRSAKKESPSNRFFDLRSSVSEDHRAVAKKIAKDLSSQGFKGQHLDDLIYGIADEICCSIADQLVCDEEYQLANELNTESMVDQISVLLVWTGTEEKLRFNLSKHLLISLT